MEKFRQRNGTPWSEAVNWHNKLFPLNIDDSVTEKNINKKWSRNYKRIQHMKVTQSRKLNEYLESPHVPPVKKRSSKEEVLHKLANPPLDQINVAPDPLLAMAQIQGAVMGKYVNKLENQQVHNTKRIKNLQGKVETLTLQKDKLDEEKRAEDAKVKYLQLKVRKTETALQKEKEKVAYLKPRNVRRRDETKQKQISQLKNKLVATSEDANKLSSQLKHREAEIAKKNQTIQKLEEKYSAKVKKEKIRKLRAQKVASKLRQLLEISAKDNYILRTSHQKLITYSRSALLRKSKPRNERTNC